MKALIVGKWQITRLCNDHFWIREVGDTVGEGGVFTVEQLERAVAAMWAKEF